MANGTTGRELGPPLSSLRRVRFSLPDGRSAPASSRLFCCGSAEGSSASATRRRAAPHCFRLQMSDRKPQKRARKKMSGKGRGCEETRGTLDRANRRGSETQRRLGPASTRAVRTLFAERRDAAVAEGLHNSVQARRAGGLFGSQPRPVLCPPARFFQQASENLGPVLPPVNVAVNRLSVRH